MSNTIKPKHFLVDNFRKTIHNPHLYQDEVYHYYNAIKSARNAIDCMRDWEDFFEWVNKVGKQVAWVPGNGWNWNAYETWLKKKYPDQEIYTNT